MKGSTAAVFFYRWPLPWWCRYEPYFNPTDVIRKYETNSARESVRACYSVLPANQAWASSIFLALLDNPGTLFQWCHKEEADAYVGRPACFTSFFFSFKQVGLVCRFLCSTVLFCIFTFVLVFRLVSTGRRYRPLLTVNIKVWVCYNTVLRNLRGVLVICQFQKHENENGPHFNGFRNV